MDTLNRAVLDRRSFWREPLEQWQHSGLTQVAYCRQQGLKLAQIGYWKRRWRAIPVTEPVAPAGGFIAVRMAAAGTALTVVLSDPLRVEVPAGFDPLTLRAVVQALRSDVSA